MWLSIAGTLTHTVATVLHLRQAREVEQCQLRCTHPGGADKGTAELLCNLSSGMEEGSCSNLLMLLPTPLQRCCLTCFGH